MPVKALGVEGLDREDPKMTFSETTKTCLTSSEKSPLPMAGIFGIAIVVGIFAIDIYLAFKYLR